MARKRPSEAGCATMQASGCVKYTTDVRLVEMPKPRVIDPGDVIVRVTGSTICGSDLHLYHGREGCTPAKGT